jgi:hypothetical protein
MASQPRIPSCGSFQAARASTILFNLLASRGDKAPWLLPANLCPIVPITFLKAGVPFELVDVSPGTLSMSLELADAALRSGRYGGIVYSHTYGDESTPDEFFAHVKRAHTAGPARRRSLPVRSKRGSACDGG